MNILLHCDQQQRRGCWWCVWCGTCCWYPPVSCLVSLARWRLQTMSPTLQSWRTWRMYHSVTRRWSGEETWSPWWIAEIVSTFETEIFYSKSDLKWFKAGGEATEVWSEIQRIQFIAIDPGIGTKTHLEWEPQNDEQYWSKIVWDGERVIMETGDLSFTEYINLASNWPSYKTCINQIRNHLNNTWYYQVQARIMRILLWCWWRLFSCWTWDSPDWRISDPGWWPVSPSESRWRGPAWCRRTWWCWCWTRWVSPCQTRSEAGRRGWRSGMVSTHQHLWIWTKYSCHTFHPHLYLHHLAWNRISLKNSF